jgi:hypothetical protein
LGSVHVSSTKEEPKKEYSQLGIIAQIAEMKWSGVEISHMAKARLVVCGRWCLPPNESRSFESFALPTTLGRGGVPEAQRRFLGWDGAVLDP